MSQITKSAIYITLTLAIVIGPRRSRCQQSSQPPAAVAPIPAQIATAHRVFIANAGADVNAQDFFKRAGALPEDAYNRFYSAMRNWGKYDLVAGPAEADLVFEIRFTAPEYFQGEIANYEPQFNLNIVDAKTHFLVWSMAGRVEGAYRKTTWLKNLDVGLDALLDQLKRVSVLAAGEGAKQ